VEDWLLSPGQYRGCSRGCADAAAARQAFVLGVVLSLIFGVGASRPAWVRGIALVYVEFARGISSIILLFIMAIAIPILLEIRSAVASCCWPRSRSGINMGGYGAEIVRGAIQAIPKGQTEASIALNLSPTQRLRHVVLPQAMRIILPPMGNLTIEILKGTALCQPDRAHRPDAGTRNLIQQQLAAGVADVTVLFVNVLVIYFVSPRSSTACSARRAAAREALRGGEPRPRSPTVAIPGVG
jgi:polar amino acid transport system permease protein